MVYQTELFEITGLDFYLFVWVEFWPIDTDFSGIIFFTSFWINLIYPYVISFYGKSGSYTFVPTESASDTTDGKLVMLQEL